MKRPLARNAILWVGITVLPIAALWFYGLITDFTGYEGTCRLPTRGYHCTRWEYIEDTLFGPFVAPGLIAASMTWLLIVAIGALVLWVFFKLRQ